MPKRARERKISSRRDNNEYVKSAAWAWYQHGAGKPSKLTSESDVQIWRKAASTTTRPSRFKLEAARLANLNTTSQSFNKVSTKPRSLDGLDKSVVGFYEMLEFHENEDLGDSSLLDHYEILELTRSLNKSLSISVKKSAVHNEKSWLEHGLSAMGDNDHKKKDFKVSKSAVVKHWWTPKMCSMTDVVIPGMAEIGSPKRSPSVKHHRSRSQKNGRSKLSEWSHGVRQRLQQALLVSPWKSQAHGNNNVRASSARRNSWDYSNRRQSCDHGSS